MKKAQLFVLLAVAALLSGIRSSYAQAINTGALALNGSSQFVTFQNNASLRLPVFTLECWFKRTGAGDTVSTGNGGITAAVPLVTKGRGEADGSNVDMNYFMGVTAAGLLCADFEDLASGANHPVTGKTTIVNNVWHHAAATYDGTTWRLYLNGRLETEKVEGAQPRNDSIQHAAIGSALQSTGAADGFFAGEIDEVRIWSVAQPASAICINRLLEFNSAAGLVAAFSMDQVSGTNLVSDSTPAITGTLTAGPVLTTLNLQPLFTPGQVPSPVAIPPSPGAVLFNGSNQTGRIPAHALLQVSSFTIESWVCRSAGGTAVTIHIGSGQTRQVWPLISKGRTAGDTPQAANMNYLLGIDAQNGKLLAAFESAAGADFSIESLAAAPALAIDVWHHAATAYDHLTGAWSLFLDGAVVGSKTLTGSPAPVPNTLSTHPAGFGTTFSNAGTPVASGFFSGLLDDVRIWRAARTQQEILASIHCDFVQDANLVGRWALDDLSGTTFRESITPTALVGTLSASTMWRTPQKGNPLLLSSVQIAPTAAPDTFQIDAALTGPAGQEATVRIFGGRKIADPPFTVAFLPDTQHYVDSAWAPSQPAVTHSVRKELFRGQMEFIRSSRAAFAKRGDPANAPSGGPIVFVSHCGDVVENRETEQQEWTDAGNFMGELHQSALRTNPILVPYGLCPGNHDENQTTGAGTSFDAFFGRNFFAGNLWYGGFLGMSPSDPAFFQQEANKTSKCNFQRIDIGSLRLLVIHLDWDLPLFAVEWAKRVLNLPEHKDRLAIVTVHKFLTSGGGRFGAPGVGADMRRTTADTAMGNSSDLLPGTNLNLGQSPEFLFRQVVVNNPRVMLVACGHEEGALTITNELNAVRMPILQMLQDFQGERSGGGGFVRYLVFNSGNNMLEGFTFSDNRDQDFNGTNEAAAGLYRTGSGAEFSFSYPLKRRLIDAENVTLDGNGQATFSAEWKLPGTASDMFEWHVEVVTAAGVITSAVLPLTTPGWAVLDEDTAETGPVAPVAIDESGLAVGSVEAVAGRSGAAWNTSGPLSGASSLLAPSVKAGTSNLTGVSGDRAVGSDATGNGIVHVLSTGANVSLPLPPPPESGEFGGVAAFCINAPPTGDLYAAGYVSRTDYNGFRDAMLWRIPRTGPVTTGTIVPTLLSTLVTWNHIYEMGFGLSDSSTAFAGPLVAGQRDVNPNGTGARTARVWGNVTSGDPLTDEYIASVGESNYWDNAWCVSANSDGQIATVYQFGNLFLPVVWTTDFAGNRVGINLPLPPDLAVNYTNENCSMIIQSINNNGVAVGYITGTWNGGVYDNWALDSTGYPAAVVWVPSTNGYLAHRLANLVPPDGGNSYGKALAINDENVIIGTLAPGSAAGQKGFVARLLTGP